jgi:hypothetical protein
MKTAGDILSALFDEGFVKKAHEYSKLFASWADITAKNGITAAADHSSIKDLDDGILLIEMDHPGWKQILQTKQGKLLNDFRRRFPELNISGISLMLGRSEPRTAVSQTSVPREKTEPQEQIADTEEPAEPGQGAQRPEVRGYNAIKDGDFKESLKKLEQTISAKRQPGADKTRE